MKKCFRGGSGIVTVFAVFAIAASTLTACAVDEHVTPALPEKPAASQAAPSSSNLLEGDQAATFVAVIDGDTVETSAGTVRIIGIDTPERGECGHDEASMVIGRLIANGDTVTLTLPEGQNDEDHHGRLLRYITTGGGVDIGLAQLEAGNAVARYDSRDGYPAHPKEADYHAAQLAGLDSNRKVVTTSCAEQVAAAPAPASTPSADSEIEDWWTQYGSCTKLKKNTVGHPKGPFNVNNPAEFEIYQWFVFGTGHNGDGDGDGLACE